MQFCEGNQSTHKEVVQRKQGYLTPRNLDSFTLQELLKLEIKFLKNMKWECFDARRSFEKVRIHI